MRAGLLGLIILFVTGCGENSASLPPQSAEIEKGLGADAGERPGRVIVISPPPDVPTRSPEEQEEREFEKRYLQVRESDVASIEKELERARRAGSDDYDYYAGMVEPIRRDIAKCLGTEDEDPAPILKMINWYPMTSWELGDDLEKVRDRAKVVGLAKVAKVRDNLWQVFHLMRTYELSATDVDLSEEEFQEWLFESATDRSPINTGGSGIETGVIARGFLPRRRTALQKLIPRLAIVIADPSHETLLVENAQIIHHWNFSAQELKISPDEREKLLEEARSAAMREAKQLLQKCRATVSSEHKLEKVKRLKDLLLLVPPETVGITINEIAALVAEEQYQDYKRMRVENERMRIEVERILNKHLP